MVLRTTLTNVGDRAGTEVVQLYVRDEVATVARPWQALVGFARVLLEPGRSASVDFEVHPSRLAFYDEAMRFVTEPGTFRFSVGGASDRASQHCTAELSGAVAQYRQREVVATAVTLSPA